MANSMNNWLGFSLSPQDHSQNSVFNSDEISGTQVSSECFDLTSESTIPSLNLPVPFAIFQDFQRNNHSQEWNMKDVGLNSFSCSSQNLENQERPKLENFLGVSGLTFNDQEHKKLQSTADTYIYQEAAEATSQTTSNTMGLSMIKNWLRNNPAQPQAAENKRSYEVALPPPSTSSVQTLSLSMSTGSQSSSHLPLKVNGESSSSGNNEQQRRNALDNQTSVIEPAPKKSIDTFGQRTSIYRGVTRHRWTGRYEAHLWDNSCRREGQTRKGRQGGYDKEEKAARSYDLAALKYWGTSTTTNFPMSNYEKEIEEMKHMTRQEYVASLRRKSSGFSRGASIYRGVTRHHQHGRWQARIGRVAGNKDLYLGTFSTQEEAAEAYDIAAIKFRGLNAVTNFEINRYDVKSILESSTLPIGGAAKRLKDAEMALDIQRSVDESPNSHLTDGLNGYCSHHGWPTIAFQQAQPLSMHTPYGHQRDIQQLQLGNAQNFLQHSVLHNLMSLDSSSIEHSSDSNSIIYSNVAGDGNGNDGHFFAPMGTVIAQEGNPSQANCYQENEVKPLEYENMFGPGSGDPYHQERNFYYQSQQPSSNGLVKASSVCDQASTCNNWIPTAIPTLAARPNNMALCHGGSTFTVWNQT
ncbi:AP2-like ethylene-responsive transcription factor BBM [Abeliophyllum distichum]|uniref:AP2-like ethylene-responsive transcription factor BBM n=1 Tax=Abeliophyllum distichum TaxID=126358 RepID=A0ABD1UMF8_9LAMI